MPISFKDTIDSARIGGLQWGIAALLTGVIILDGLDLQLASYSAPLLMAQWQLTKPEFAPLLAAAMIGMAVGAMIGGWASDRYGRKRTLVASVVLFGAMTLVCAGASGPRMFVAWRFLSGCGFGTAFPVATAMMSEWMPRRATGKAISIMTLGFPIGAIGGALAASRLLPQIGWQGCFTGAGLLCLAFAGLLLWRLPESPSYLILRGRQRDAHALLALAWRRPVGDGAEAFYLERVRERGGGLFTRGNARVNTGLWLAVLCNSLATYVLAGWLTVVLVGLQIPLATALRGPVIFSVSAILGTLATGWTLVRLGSRPVMIALALASMVGATALSVAVYVLPPGATLITALFTGLALQGFCTGGLQAALYVLAANVYETDIRSRGIGFATIMGRVGTIVSSFAGAAILEVAHESGFFALTAILGVAVVTGILVVNRHIAAAAGSDATRQKRVASAEGASKTPRPA